MQFQLKFACRDLLQSLRQLWLFAACLMFGVCLVMAAASLYQMLDRELLADTRALMGGDVEIESSQAIDNEALNWLASTGTISLTRELNTMLSTQDDEFTLVELLSTDQAYPLYGELKLHPANSLEAALAKIAGQWGVALDPGLAERLNVRIGDEVYVGELTLQVRAVITEQPDRRLNASWRGAPVLIADEAMNAAGLIRPGSRVEYEYRIKTEQDLATWKANFINRFPDTDWEIQTFADRSQRIADRLAQIASGLLIVAFSTLFIGGLGVFNSITVYLQSKREAIATLKACGLRDGRVGQVFIIQIGLLAAFCGIIGVALGGGLALMGSALIAQDLTLTMQFNDILLAALAAWLFGVITAFTFTMPALGRALQVDVAHLFRSSEANDTAISIRWRLASVSCAALLATLVLLAIPNILFGLAFITTVLFCLVFFEGVVHGLRWLSQKVVQRRWLAGHAATRMALANLHRPGTPLRITLLSLGTALTLLVACSVVVVSLLRLVQTTLPEQSPALVLYDVLASQQQAVTTAVERFDSVTALTLSPLVRARVSAINGTSIRELAANDINWQDMARDEHKLSYLSGNIDDINLIAGTLWDETDLNASLAGTQHDFALIMEDREAAQMQLKVGDSVQFSFDRGERTGLLTGIYSQKGLQTRFWFEAILSDGALDEAINMYVGTVSMDEQQALTLQRELARSYPNIITVRTKDIIDAASELLTKGTQGLSVVSAVSFLVSLMVLASVMAAGRAKQRYHAIILYCVGARLSYIRRAIAIEYALLATVVTVFSTVLGLFIAALVLQARLKVYEWDLYWLGGVIALSASATIFSLAAWYLFRQLNIQPARLLQEAV